MKRLNQRLLKVGQPPRYYPTHSDFTSRFWVYGLAFRCCWRNVFILVLSCIALAACQPKKREIDQGDLSRGAAGEIQSNDWRNDREYFQPGELVLDELVQWQYSGKVGLTSDKLKETASLLWEFRDQSNRIRLFGPLGVGAVELEFDQYGVQLSDSKGVVHRGQSAQTLLTDIVGWPLPIDALSRWLFVLPAPENAFQYRLNADLRVVSIRQLGWQIDYSDYRQYADRFLPRKLIASKQFETGGQGAVTVKLITKSWQW